MTTTNATTIELAPNYRLPSIVIVFGSLIIALNPWIGGIVALFGIFLMIQSATLRLQFSPTALDIYRGEKLIRAFPYSEWQHWEIFWPAFPVLFYFREVKSIHFLPILFDPIALKQCLETHGKRTEPTD
jgi:hypothetical protein